MRKSGTCWASRRPVAGLGGSPSRTFGTRLRPRIRIDCYWPVGNSCYHSALQNDGLAARLIGRCRRTPASRMRWTGSVHTPCRMRAPRSAPSTRALLPPRLQGLQGGGRGRLVRPNLRQLCTHVCRRGRRAELGLRLGFGLRRPLGASAGHRSAPTSRSPLGHSEFGREGRRQGAALRRERVRVSCARLSPGCQGSRGTSRTRRGPSIFSWGGYPSKLLPASTTGRHRNNLTRWQPLISIEIC